MRDPAALIFRALTVQRSTQGNKRNERRTGPGKSCVRGFATIAGDVGKTSFFSGKTLSKQRDDLRFDRFDEADESTVRPLDEIRWRYFGLDSSEVQVLYLTFHISGTMRARCRVRWAEGRQ